MKTSDVFMVIVEKPVPRFKCHPCNEFMRLLIDFEEPNKKYNYCPKCGKFGEVTPTELSK